MKKKTFKLQELDCANCAAKIENAISKLDGVNSISVNFMGQKMILEAPEDRFDAIFEAIKKLVKKMEPDVCILAAGGNHV